MIYPSRRLVSYSISINQLGPESLADVEVLLGGLVAASTPITASESRPKEKTLDRLKVKEEVKAKKKIAFWQGMAYACESDAHITTRFLLPLFSCVQSMVVGIDGKREKRLFGDDQWTALALSVLGIGDAIRPIMSISVSK
jgi:hypothetical protein